MTVRSAATAVVSAVATVAAYVLQAWFGRDRAWTPRQVEVLRAVERFIVVDGGRRFGKSYVGGAKVVIRTLARMNELAEDVRRGKRKPWSGIGKPADKARHEAPDVEIWVVTPRERQLEVCRRYIRQYFTGRYERWLHPKLALCDGGKQMWLLANGVSARIRFVVGQSVTSMVSGALDGLWLDEAGLMDGAVIDALLPVLWERQAWVVATGTPSMGVEHWFTRWCLQGMDPSHEYYIPDIVKPDPRFKTVIGTSFEAFLDTVREEAALDAERRGDAWVSQWLKGDFRLPGVFIYDNWDEHAHVVKYDPVRRRLGNRQLPPPSAILGVKDFAYSVTRQGAAVVFHVWLQSPLDRETKRRPLVIAVKDVQEAMEYAPGGWWQTLHDLRTEYHVQLWYADPSRAELLLNAYRQRGFIGPMKPAEKADKAGRILLVKSLLEHNEHMPPGLLISDECRHLPRQFAAYRWKLDSEKNPTNVPRDDDDHCLDCCAFLMGMIMRGGWSVPQIRL